MDSLFTTPKLKSMLQKYAAQLLAITEAETAKFKNIECPTLFTIVQKCHELSNRCVYVGIRCSSVGNVGRKFSEWEGGKNAAYRGYDIGNHDRWPSYICRRYY